MKLVYLQTDMLVPKDAHVGMLPSLCGLYVDDEHNWKLSVSTAARTLRAGERAQTAEADRPKGAERENDETAMR